MTARPMRMIEATPPLHNEQMDGATSLDIEAAAAMAGIERAITVGLIATPRSELRTCAVNEPAQAVLQRDDLKYFDFIPVLGENRIVGLFDRFTLSCQAPLPDGSAEHYMQPLSEENLISADASALTFVSTVDKRPCCLVLGGEGIEGIVTFADLQRLPVRPMLFVLITHLEVLMTRGIKLVHGEGENWLGTVPEEAEDLKKRLETQKKKRSELGTLAIAPLYHKAKSLAATARLGELSKFFAEGAFRPVRELRNDLAHPKEAGAANNYAVSRDAAFETAKTVRFMQELIREISEFCRIAASKGCMGS